MTGARRIFRAAIVAFALFTLALLVTSASPSFAQARSLRVSRQGSVGRVEAIVAGSKCVASSRGVTGWPGPLRFREDANQERTMPGVSPIPTRSANVMAPSRFAKRFPSGPTTSGTWAY